MNREKCDFKKLECVTWEHRYENRVTASHTILKNDPVEPALIKK